VNSGEYIRYISKLAILNIYTYSNSILYLIIR